MLHYILQLMTFQMLFLAVYEVLLKKETFFQWNRVYLLATSVLSIFLPLIKLETLKHVVPKDYIIALPEVVLGNRQPALHKTIYVNNESIGFQWGWEYIYFSGMVIALLILLVKAYRVINLLRFNTIDERNNVKLIKLPKSNDAFSFFNIVFLGENLNKSEIDHILKHEIVHIKQKHTIDLLLFELFRIVFWFNPFIYLYQNRISILHEYIADAEVSKNQDQKAYYQSLLSQVFGVNSISFINPFFKKSLIKKRIIMLQKSKSRQVQLFKYLLLLPLIAGMLFYSSCSESKSMDDTMEQRQVSVSESLDIIKDQILQKGSLNDSEENGLLLLAGVLKSNELDQSLILETQAYIDLKDKTVVESQIANILAEIQVSGGLMDVDLIKLKKLLVFIQPDGFNDPSYGDVVNKVEVPFSVVEKAPEFLGCEGLASNEEKKECFNRSISEFVAKNFNTQLGKDLGLTGIQKIYVVFKIGTDGRVNGVKARAQHPALEEEAVRVVKILPEFTPGEQKGKKVVVPYSLPISLMVN